MYKYETHLHTFPVSACAKSGVKETLDFYKGLGYDGVFITNHFLDGNINIDKSLSYQEKIDFYFSDYEQGLIVGKEIGIKVFLGIEISYGGTDFLIYGLDKDWFIKNPQIMDMNIKDKLAYFMQSGGYIVHAHPYREAGYIDHIRLYPRSINAVEIINANSTELENKMARLYAENYNLFQVAGSDNHIGGEQSILVGVISETPINCEQDYISKIENKQIRIFIDDN